MLTFDASIVGPWVSEKTGGTWCAGRGQAIGKVVDRKLVAGVLYEDFNKANVVCHIAGEGNWADRRFLAIIFDYPFNQLKVRRITVPIAGNNAKSIKLVEHMGFQLESRLEQATLDSDLLLFRLFKDECKYLKGKYADFVRTT
jgi:RimJ/RimL family protein N-acetyltransferase